MRWRKREGKRATERMMFQDIEKIKGEREKGRE